jgi:hypothetical protein
VTKRKRYCPVYSSTWTSATARGIRKIADPLERANAFVVMDYLRTNPSANMIGLYEMPLETLSFHTGIHLEGAIKALNSLSDLGYCKYDHPTEMVWVVAMVTYQVGDIDNVKPGDKRCIGVCNELNRHRHSPFYPEFIERYAARFHLNVGDPSKPHLSPLQASESVNQGISESVNQGISESVNQGISESVNQGISGSVNTPLSFPRTAVNLSKETEERESYARTREAFNPRFEVPKAGLELPRTMAQTTQGSPPTPGTRGKRSLRLNSGHTSGPFSIAGLTSQTASPVPGEG